MINEIKESETSENEIARNFYTETAFGLPDIDEAISQLKNDYDVLYAMHDSKELLRETVKNKLNTIF